MAKAKSSNAKSSVPSRDATGPKDANASSPAERISERIEQLGDWRGEMLARVRTLIKQADPGIIEEWKWDVPVWSSNGIICTGETYKKAVKLTFAKGASLKDPSNLFNSSLEGKTRRAIDLFEGQLPDGIAFKALVREAAALNGDWLLENTSGRPPTARTRKKTKSA